MNLVEALISWFFGEKLKWVLRALISGICLLTLQSICVHLFVVRYSFGMLVWDPEVACFHFYWRPTVLVILLFKLASCPIKAKKICTYLQWCMQ
jgi:hypothetical protein